MNYLNALGWGMLVWIVVVIVCYVHDKKVGWSWFPKFMEYSAITYICVCFIGFAVMLLSL